MPCTKLIIALLYAIATVLPIVAAFRAAGPKLDFARRLGKVQRPDGEASYKAMSMMTNEQQKSVLHTGRDLFWDITLASIGLITGATASIWSLFI